MKVFFNSNHSLPGGPVQVNRNLLKALGDRVVARHDRWLPLRILHSAWHTLTADAVVFSGLLVRDYEVRLARLLGKKILYIMHGSTLLENGVEHPHEKLQLRNADIILPVSEFFAERVRDLYPQYAAKIMSLTNGVDWTELDRIVKSNQGLERDSRRVILFGGGRSVKKNLQVCQAVERLNREAGTNLRVDVYGYFRDTDSSAAIAAMDCVEFHHVIPHDEVMRELMKSAIYVQNSSYEPFSLGLIDALAMGCDVLFSKYVGAKEIIQGKTDYDVIDNPLDIDEIKSKLLHLIDAPNNRRLLDSIDRRATSLEASAGKLLDLCSRLSQPHES